MGIFKFFKNTTKTVYPKKYLNYSTKGFFEIRPLYDLKDNLTYMHCHILYEDNYVLVQAKKDKGVIYKYVIIKDLDAYKSINLTNEKLVSFNLGKEFKYGFVVEELGKLPMVEIHILSDMNEENIKYTLKMPVPNKDLYKVALVYDDTYHILVQFSYLPTFGPLYNEFKIAMYKDINAHDKENY